MTPSTPACSVAVVARSELFGCGIEVALQVAGIDVQLVSTPSGGFAPPRGLDAPLVLIEWNVPGPDDWSLLQTLRTTNPQATLLISALDLDAADVRRLTAQGVDGAVLRSASGEQLAAGLRDARAGAPGWPIPTPARENERTGLTARQAEILDLICAGLPNTDIAEHLALSINSIKSHIRSAYRTMGVQRRSEAVLWGLARGFGATPPTSTPDTDR